MPEEEFRIGSFWITETEEYVVIDDVIDNIVYFHFLDAPGATYSTSKPAFKLFYESIGPEEEGLILLSRLQ